MFKECGRWTTDGQQRPTYPTNSPMSLWLRWAKNDGMAASIMTTILNIFKPPYLPYFWANFEKPCIKINDLPSTLLQSIFTAYIAFPFKYLTIHALLCYQKFLQEKTSLKKTVTSLLTPASSVSKPTLFRSGLTEWYNPGSEQHMSHDMTKPTKRVCA